ncbi:MAG: cytochrome C peroxidase [Gemmatimonadaceae bacterium]|nr:cytochrome C peroxidase [Chitinophagaceae bacterium]
MKKFYILCSLFVLVTLSAFFNENAEKTLYSSVYSGKIESLRTSQLRLIDIITNADLSSPSGKQKISEQINECRKVLKGVDFWLRYLEPTVYKKINGPLPVEWETEVFEKFEKPYKREGAGFTLAAVYLDEEEVNKDSLISLIKSSFEATETYRADSITNNLQDYHHFYLCNRLMLLNLASIYTTGFECPDTNRVIPELRLLLSEAGNTYETFNHSFDATPLTRDYLLLFKNALNFAEKQPDEYSSFDHFTFVKDYISPLYTMNQQLIRQYRVVTKSFVDYSLNKSNTSLFSKDLYNGQNSKGIFLRVSDENVLDEIDRVGKLLFYDPILSGNNKRSCASCHKPTEFFTDTTATTAFQFDNKGKLDRNTPTLINVGFNHLVMLDGKHISLQDQTKSVMMNPTELGSNEKEMLNKVLSCKDYKIAFTRLLEFTPQEDEITLDHITSAITFYYSKFSKYYSPFDDAMENKSTINQSAKTGFNLFMSKSQCATCHFVPQFNGVKPPFVSSEFEVLGVPRDTLFSEGTADKGRFNVNPAHETGNAFRTGSIRNAAHTAPYMHNGVFTTMTQVIDFYDGGGGAGRGLDIPNQTLSSDSLHLSGQEKKMLIAFIESLNEKIVFEKPPVRLPLSSSPSLNKRKIGGEY